MKAFFILTLFLLGSGACCAQPDTTSPRIKSLYLEAENYKNNFDYTGAIETYKRILTYEKDNLDVIISIADCYFKTKNYDQACEWYDAGLLYKNLSPPHGVQYANALLIIGKTDKARTWLENYIQIQPHDIEAREKLDGLKNIEIFFTDSSRYTITPSPINSSGPEFAPTPYKNGIAFVSGERTRRAKTQKSNTATSYLDLYYYNISGGDSATLESFNKPVNTKLHEGPATFYDGETKMIFTRNNKTKAGKWNNIDIVHFQLFYAELNEKGEWSEPLLLTINDSEYSMGHPTITKTGTTLYFSSNIPGGFGGADIYRTQLVNNQWSKPENLGDQINTTGNEMFPFIYNDSILYFASDGFQGLGGLDIYKVNINAHKGVLNLGYPINTNKDDFSITLYHDGLKGFFASNRDGGLGSDDIYEFTEKPDSAKEQQPSEKIQPNSDSSLIVSYTIQILALKNPKVVARSFMKKLSGVIRHHGKDGLYRYTYGEYEGQDAAFAMLKIIQDMGYKDAFVRRVEKYVELSTGTRENTDVLYETMGRINQP